MSKKSELKTKINFECTDTLWNKLKFNHRTKYPKDKSNMNTALTRAVEEFTK